MKKIIFTLFLAIMATTGLYAQQISVVSPGGATSLYRTLPDAINGADPGSVIYLPGGTFTISNDVKITKELTIIGIGNKPNNDNVDGCTIIAGNLNFGEISSGSALMGCYIIGKVIIEDNQCDISIKFCNVNEISISESCNGIFINQNYILRIGGAGSNSLINNNIIGNCSWANRAVIKNNIITEVLWDCHNSIITNNVLCSFDHTYSSNNLEDNNLVNDNFKDFFVNYNGISPTSNFHFKETYIQYENQVGIYAGDGFNDKQLAPVPYIIAKRVDEQTDASGKLNIKIRVKAGE